MPYDEFALSVSDFFDSFFAAMDRQVENAVRREWGRIELDKRRLQQEYQERKEEFSGKLSFLTNPKENTDWDHIRALYAEMERGISFPDRKPNR